jgi:hypothetical protein
VSESVFLIGNGEITRIEGSRGVTPECPEALFKLRETIRVRRLSHLRHLPEIGAVVAIVPPGFSPDWAWADLCGRPRPLMHQVPSRHISYIVAFENDKTPHLLREKYLRKSDLPPADVRFET